MTNIEDMLSSMRQEALYLQQERMESFISQRIRTRHELQDQLD